MSEHVQFEVGGEFDDKHFKSCFARSVSVNLKCKQPKSLDRDNLQLQPARRDDLSKKPFVSRPFNLESQEVVRLRKNSRGSLDETRRFSLSQITSKTGQNDTRRSLYCSSRISEVPIENIVNQSKIETLQWQMKEIQKSREMYRAVMKQVVTFLEKAHQSLELLGSRINKKNSVSRSKSEHHVFCDNSRMLNDSNNGTLKNGCTLDDYATFKDNYWRPVKEGLSPEEIPPDKLAKEAFRLLRTAQSLLNTQEPDLAQTDEQRLDPETDIEFLAQLAKEFPTPEPKPQRATSFSLSPKLILPENDVKISTAFNRKLSLQLSEVQRSSISKQTLKNADSARGSVAESEMDFSSDFAKFEQKGKSEKSTSPATGSISSVEDESGFSSMNSFQEVGLPLSNSTMNEEVTAKTALLRSMLHNNSDFSSSNFSRNNSSTLEGTVVSRTPKEKHLNYDEVKLWQKPLSAPQHKRWYSLPVEEAENQALKVLWV